MGLGDKFWMWDQVLKICFISIGFGSDACRAGAEILVLGVAVLGFWVNDVGAWMTWLVFGFGRFVSGADVWFPCFALWVEILVLALTFPDLGSQC